MAEVYDTGHTAGTDQVSRKRFNDRVKRHARRAIYKSIEKGNVTDIGEGGVDVHVTRDDLKQPDLVHGEGGVRRVVRPGNKEFQAGDKLPRPKGGGGGSGSGKASDGGEGNDDFVYHLSREEFLEILFDDLGLPNMRRLNIQQTNETKPKFAGYSNSGPNNRIDRKRTKRRKMGRILAGEGGYNREILAGLTEIHNILSAYDPAPPPPKKELFGYDNFVPLSVQCNNMRTEVTRLKDAFYDLATPEEHDYIEALEDGITPLEAKKRLVPRFNKSTDLQVRNFPSQPVPQNRGVMFCLMDVSGSMDEDKKTKAKILFYLTYMLLQQNYESVDVVFVRHHTTAKEVDEKEFFYGTETGGTMVSSGLAMVNDIIEKRYLGKNYDIYMTQGSDGDNFEHDMPKTEEEMRKLLGYVRGAFYAEITSGKPQSLWHLYEQLSEEYSDRFWTGKIVDREDIWPLFRSFFSHGESSSSNKPKMAAMLPA